MLTPARDKSRARAGVPGRHISSAADDVLERQKDVSSPAERSGAEDQGAFARSPHPIRVWLREPLLHFVLLGTVLFAAHGFVAKAPVPEAAGRIIVTAADVDRLRELWALQWQRPPTTGELRDLIDGHVREEVLYREALAMGLDRDDTIIKRRLAQKLQFLTADLATARAPTAAELTAFFAANPERYRLPARVSFSQIYFSPDRRGPAAEHDAGLVLAGLRAGTGAPAKPEQGDRLMLEEPQRQQTAQEIEAAFGRGFADAVLQLAPGDWHGPIASGYGWHLVRVEERREARLPMLAEVEGQVRSDWTYEQRQQANEAVLQQLLARYEVIIDHSPLGEPTAVKTGDQP